MEGIWDFVSTRPTDAGALGWVLPVTLQILALVITLLLAQAFLMYFDRKVWAAVMMRKGPNVVGPFGLLQSFADLLKNVFKEIIIPSGADKVVFILAPLVTFVLALVGWAVIPVAPGWVISDINVGILYLFAISSLGVYGVIMGGWASNSKYPFLGSLRSAAQMVSYEVSLGFVIITVLLLVGSANLSDIVESQSRGTGLLNWHFIPLFPMFVIFFISALAETNRPPFDLPEAESELVAGYQVEYSSTPFLLFMIGELANIVLMCAMLTILFFGGWHSPIDVPILNQMPVFWFCLKIVFFFFLFAMVKAITPRYRYDQLMRIGWKLFLPLTMIYVVLVAGAMLFIPGVADLFQSWRTA
ncbi:MAG: NADH-quinone oxidoreductase subunit NuoH [Pseudomonadota bacterium]